MEMLLMLLWIRPTCLSLNVLTECDYASRNGIVLGVSSVTACNNMS